MFICLEIDYLLASLAVGMNIVGEMRLPWNSGILPYLSHR
jgi:hypothetical protein